jgi:chromosome segregation ATPase
MESVSINPGSLKRFTKHLCIIAKKHHEREAAHEELNDQLSKIKRISTNKRLTKTALKSELNDLENKISLVLKKEAELYQSGKIERIMIQKLKNRIEELEQSRNSELSRKDAELSSIQNTLDLLQKKQDEVLNKRAMPGLKKLDENNLEKSTDVSKKPTDDKEQIRQKIQDLESKYKSLEGKYSATVLSPIKNKIADLKTRI